MMKARLYMGCSTTHQSEENDGPALGKFDIDGIVSFKDSSDVVATHKARCPEKPTLHDLFHQVAAAIFAPQRVSFPCFDAMHSGRQKKMRCCYTTILTSLPISLLNNLVFFLSSRWAQSVSSCAYIRFHLYLIRYNPACSS